VADLETNLQRADTSIRQARRYLGRCNVLGMTPSELEMHGALIWLAEAVHDLEQAIRKVHEPGYESVEDIRERLDRAKAAAG
jgi:hypothetical protein